MNVLVISAHPDDETLGCGGTMLRHAAAGDALHWLVATAADEARYGATAKKKAAEAEQVAMAYPVAKLHRLGYPPAQLDRVSSQELIDRVSGVAAAVQPEVVYTVGPGDVHSDHRIVFDAVEAALKSFRAGDRLRRILVYETLSSTDVRISPGPAFRASTFVDITTTLEKKLEILGMYGTELQKPPQPRNAETCRALARVRGAAAGVMYAEAFQLVREVVRSGEPL